MSNLSLYQCEGEKCQNPPYDDQTSVERSQYYKMNLLLSRLDEQQRRWYVALEAERLGRRGVPLMAQISGLDEKTIRRGRAELNKELQDRPTDRIRQIGGGRIPAQKKTRP